MISTQNAAHPINAPQRVRRTTQWRLYITQSRDCESALLYSTAHTVPFDVASPGRSPT